MEPHKVPAPFRSMLETTVDLLRQFVFFLVFMRVFGDSSVPLLSKGRNLTDAGN